MPPLMLVLLLLVVGGIAFWLGRASVPAGGAEALEASAAGEVARRDRFIEELRETTWQHRDLAPELATIVLDEISTFRKELS